VSVIDSATCYLWLFPIRHKTAECVAATLFDDVISRVSVSSAILTDQGGEFMGKVVECLLQRLGITHLRTSAYHPQTDAKCKRVHFSVHNIITKLIDDKHERWPDLLGTVVLVYNATVHTATGYYMNFSILLHRLVLWMLWCLPLHLILFLTQTSTLFKLSNAYRKLLHSLGNTQASKCKE